MRRAGEIFARFKPLSEAGKMRAERRDEMAQFSQVMRSDEHDQPIADSRSYANSDSHSSAAFVINASESKITPAIETACDKLFFTTFDGSRTPAFSRSSTFSVIALNPKVGLACSTSSSNTELSKPAFETICLNGASQAFRESASPPAPRYSA